MTSQAPHPFAGLDGAQASERTTKPRGAGRTMVADWGLGLQQQRDLTQTSAEHFDFAKIAVGMSRLYSAELLGEKIHRLRRELIERYGTQVNIGNCSPDDPLSLEAFRRGLGVNAGSP